MNRQIALVKPKENLCVVLRFYLLTNDKTSDSTSCSVWKTKACLQRTARTSRRRLTSILGDCLPNVQTRGVSSAKPDDTYNVNKIPLRMLQIEIMSCNQNNGEFSIFFSISRLHKFDMCYRDCKALKMPLSTKCGKARLYILLHTHTNFWWMWAMGEFDSSKNRKPTWKILGNSDLLFNKNYSQKHFFDLL